MVGNIGESTQSEIEYAKKHGKEVKYLEETQGFAQVDDEITLSDDAKKILDAAADHPSGYVLKTFDPDKSMSIRDCLSILNAEGNQKDIERCNAVLGELMAADFLQKVDMKGNLLKITNVGYKFRDSYWVVPVLFKMSYDEYVASLLAKYGEVEGDYFLGETLKKNDQIHRNEYEGLFIHHIDEDKTIRLSDAKYVRDISHAPFEYQRAERLVYCNLTEHMILHMKIVEKELAKPVNFRNSVEPVGIGGINAIAREANSVLTFKSSPRKPYFDSRQEIVLKMLSGRWLTIFVKAVKYFVENIKTRTDFCEWYGTLVNIDDRLKYINMIYEAHPINYNESINMDDYRREAEYSASCAKGTGRA